MVSKQVDYAESDKLISFYVRESWKILNFNYVSYHCCRTSNFCFQSLKFRLFHQSLKSLAVWAQIMNDLLQSFGNQSIFTMVKLTYKYIFGLTRGCFKNNFILNEQSTEINEIFAQPTSLISFHYIADDNFIN